MDRAAAAGGIGAGGQSLGIQVKMYPEGQRDRGRKDLLSALRGIAGQSLPGNFPDQKSVSETVAVSLVSFSL
jgi:hypothetical protein